MSFSDDPLIGIRRAAEQLGRGPLLLAITHGHLSSIRVGGTFRFRQSAIDKVAKTSFERAEGDCRMPTSNAAHKPFS